MAGRLGQLARQGIFAAIFVLAWVIAPVALLAAPFAAYVMDARTGETIYARNADTPLHPASLTKMMTLYIAFQAIERGEVSLDTEVTITSEAAAEPPSKLGLRSGQRIKMRYLIRAAAVKSANDAAMAIGIALGGSKQGFARRMNQTASAMGMRNTHFLNPNGLTEVGHYSSAHDMSILGRHLIYDFPQYYNLFSRRTADAGMAQVANTNRRFLDSYEGADGIKTGFTNAAGYNLTASAQRGNVRIIATVFGGTSTANRNAQVAELLDRGFSGAPANARVRAPSPPPATTREAPSEEPIIVAGSDTAPTTGAGKTIRVNGLITVSIRPRPRPGTEAEPDLLVADAGQIDDAVEAALASASAATAPDPVIAETTVAMAEDTTEEAEDPELLAQAALVPDTSLDGASGTAETAAAEPTVAETAVEVAAAEPAPVLPAVRPSPRPTGIVTVAATIAPATEIAPPQAAPAETQVAALPQTTIGGSTAQPETIAMVSAVAPAPAPASPEVVTRISTSSSRNYGITVGTYNSRYEAERVLVRVALNEMATLDGSLRRVVQTSRGFDANFMGLDRDTADLACRRLQARGTTCFMVGQ